MYKAREKEFLIDLLVIDFKSHLYEKKFDEIGITEISDTRDGNIYVVTKYLLDIIHYKFEPTPREELDDNFVMVDGMEEGIPWEWYQYMDKLIEQGFTPEYVLVELYQSIQGKMSFIDETQRNNHINILRNNIASFLDGYFLDETLLNSTSKDRIKSAISAIEIKN